MKALVAVPPGEPGDLVRALRGLGEGWAVLLGPGQSPKPAALERERARLMGAGPGGLWLAADGHPDLPVSGHRSWLESARRPPFGPGAPREARLGGLLAPARALAECLEAVQGTPGDWQPAALAHWRATWGDPAAWEGGALLFQESLPGAREALMAEEAAGRAWAAVHRLGLGAAPDNAPARCAEDPDAWLGAAQALSAVPTATLQGTRIAGLGAAEAVAGLGRAAWDRAFSLAFARGWHEAPAPAPAAVAKPPARVAVVHPAYGGSLNLARRSADALERLGFEVARVDFSARAAGVAQAQRLGDEGFFRDLERDILAAVADSGAQWLWILAQAPLSPGALRSLRRRGLATAFWFCEDHRVRPAWREIAPAVDFFFPMQGGVFTALMRDAGLAPMPVLPACAAREALEAQPPADGILPLTFFGAPYANRLRLFETLADLPLGLYGEGWEGRAGPTLRPLVRDSSRLTEAQGFDLFCRSSINLNLHSTPFLAGVDPEGDYVNPRTFEIAACGGFQLCDRRRDLPQAFEPGAEIETYASARELRAQIERWSSDAAGRRRVAGAARRRVAACHTYEHRLESALQAMGLRSPRAALGF